jgi:uroporphyrinogen decarboxylase
MTSRERVKAILNHKEADKIPVDCGAMHSSGISAMAYNDLKKHLGINTGDSRIYDVIQQLVIPEQWFLDKFSIDTIDLARVFSTDRSDWRDWDLPDSSAGLFPAWIHLEKRGNDWVCLNRDGEEVALMTEGAFYFNQTQHPLYGRRVESFDDLAKHMDRVSWLALHDPLWKNYF